MTYTTPDAVASVVEVLSGDDLSAHIEFATLIVSESLSDCGYSEARMEMIERYLAAHSYACYRTRIVEETIGRSTTKYANNATMGLAATVYGQQAMVLDTCQVLSTQDLASRKLNVAPSVTFLGIPADDIESDL
jgi:hypothetical protein